MRQPMSAFGGKADIAPASQNPLMTQSGHRRPSLIGFKNWRRVLKWPMCQAQSCTPSRLPC